MLNYWSGQFMQVQISAINTFFDTQAGWKKYLDAQHLRLLQLRQEDKYDRYIFSLVFI
jgi:hypothetical protein